MTIMSSSNASEEQLKRYLQVHQVHEILVLLAESVCLEQPTNVPRHMVQFLTHHFLEPSSSGMTMNNHNNTSNIPTTLPYPSSSNVVGGMFESPSPAMQPIAASMNTSQKQQQPTSTFSWMNGGGGDLPQDDSCITGGFKPFSFGTSSSSTTNYSDEDGTHHQDVEIDLESSENIRRRYSVIDRRGAVSNESMDSANVQIIPSNVVKKTAEEKLRIKGAIENNALFSALDDDELDKLFDVMETASFEPGEVIIQQGDEGELFYIIDEGSVDVYKDTKLVNRIAEGGSFGELALIYGTPRAATIKASSKDGCKCWTINRLTFRKVLMDATTAKRKKYESFLQNVRILETLDDYERLTIADALESEVFQKGDVIVKQGDPGNSFYIIVEGFVDVYKDNDKGERVNLGRLGEGDYFGEIALLLDQPRAATVVVAEDCDQVKCVRLDRRSFKSLLGNIEDLLKRNMSLYNQFMSTQI